MRGEIIWNKASSANPSVAWGTWVYAANHIFRHIHEYILVFSKEAFNRKNLPEKTNTINKDEFLSFTKSVWALPAEPARKEGHPVPFPFGLLYRLIQRYTFKDEVIVDPFCGSGFTCIAALQPGRRCIGYDIVPEYVRLAEQRISRQSEQLPLTSAVG